MNWKAVQTAGRMGTTRMSATQFHEYAVEHLCWANTAKSDKERETFEQMARAWLEAAVLWERVRAAEDEVIGLGFGVDRA
jgi:hypothetical protein